MAGSLTKPDEPLAESAPVAWALAPSLCAGDPASHGSCLWYHRIWQYLRLLDIPVPSIYGPTADERMPGF